MPEYNLDDLIKKFEEFFDLKCRRDIEKLAANYPAQKSLDIDYADLEKFDVELADELIEKPDAVIEAAERALAQMPLPRMPGTEFEPHARFCNLPDKGLLIERMGAQHINKMLCFDGLITKRAEVRPRVRIALFVCKYCDAEYKVPVGKNSKEPSVCESCKRRGLAVDEDRSYFVNLQRADAQEPLEKLRGGEPASHMDVRLEDDLVNQVVPGDNVTLTGILRIIPPMKGKVGYSMYIDVVHVKKQKREFEEIELTKEEETEIKRLAKDPKLYDKLIGSIAPALYGYDEVKEGIALQLFGGTPDLVLSGGGKIRSDMHILLIGDPGVGKTRFLQYVQQIAPKSIYVGGKTLTGVGLCVGKDSLIELNDAGMWKIGEFVEKNFREGTEEAAGAFSSEFKARVASGDASLKAGFGDISKIWRIKAPAKLVSLTTMRGKELTTTQATPLLVIGTEGIRWKKAGELKSGERIATSRKLPALRGKSIPLISLIDYPEARIATNVSKKIVEMTDKLVKKYGNLEKVGEKLGISAERLYRWRSENFYQGIPLRTYKALAKESGTDVSGRYELFCRYGKKLALPEHLDERLCYLAGLIAGDGDIDDSPERASVRFHSKDVGFLRKARRLVMEVFGVKPSIAKYGKRIPCMRFGSVIAAELFRKLGVPAGEKSDVIDIPPLLSSSGEKCVAAYLRGLYDCDGWVASPKGRGSCSIGLTTCSRELARKVLLLLEWWGMDAKLRVRDRRGQITYIDGKRVESKKIQYSLEMRGHENMRLFRKAIGFGRREKAEALDALLKKPVEPNPNLDVVPISGLLKMVKEKFGISERVLQSAYCLGKRMPSRKKLAKIARHVPDKKIRDALGMLARSDLYWDEIRELEVRDSSKEWVYDFTVNSQHAFFANGILVHNTASAEKDMDFGEGGWVLKAGALVLASGGIVSIDEFDKVSDDDKAALHEVMESQRVSIAKAGIVAQMRAKTAILAAANPEFGRFDQSKSVADQFKIIPTLLSRFDLIFPIKDILDPSEDKKLAGFVLDSHRSAAMGTEPPKSSDVPIISTELLRKYIAYARKSIRPVLSAEAADKLKGYYEEMRSLGKRGGPVPITPRQLEGLIRMSQAVAKMRLSNEVTVEDSERAIRLMEFVLRQTAFDVTTQTLDIDMITGQQKSKIDKFNAIMDIVADLQKNAEMVEVKSVVDAAKAQGIDERVVVQLIDDKVTKGDYYKPKHGYIKIVKRFE